MKRLSNRWLICSMVLLSVLSSCVSKKKYLEMTGYRDRAEKRVDELSGQVNRLETEFNTVRNDFRYSNLQKDQYIDSLNKHILGLRSNLSVSSTSIEEQINNFQLEKRRLNQLLAEKDREIRMTQQLAEERKQQMESLRNENETLLIRLKNAESETYAGNSRYNQLLATQEKTSKELEQKSMENSRLQSELKKLNAEAEMLRNQVKLLKSQIGQ